MLKRVITIMESNTRLVIRLGRNSPLVENRRLRASTMSPQEGTWFHGYNRGASTQERCIYTREVHPFLAVIERIEKKVH